MFRENEISTKVPSRLERNLLTNQGTKRTGYETVLKLDARAPAREPCEMAVMQSERIACEDVRASRGDIKDCRHGKPLKNTSESHAALPVTPWKRRGDCKDGPTFFMQRIKTLRVSWEIKRCTTHSSMN